MKIRIIYFFIVLFSIKNLQSKEFGPHCSISLKSILSDLTNELEVQSHVTKVFGSDRHYIQIPSSQLKQGKISSSVLNKEKAIFIGIQDNGHSYIVAVGKRFDGEMLYNPPKIKDSDFLSKGLVIRIEDKDGTLSDKIQLILAENQKPLSLSCVSGACKIINNSKELNVNDENLKEVLPITLVKKLIMGHLKNNTGETFNSDIILLGDGELSKQIDKIRLASYSRIGEQTFILNILAAVYGIFALLDSDE